MTETQGWIVIILLIIFGIGAVMAHNLLMDTINGAIAKLRKSFEEEIDNLKVSVGDVEVEMQNLNGMVARAMRKLNLDDGDRD